jgi:membrane protein YqaA with SNARE-associated domain
MLDSQTAAFLTQDSFLSNVIFGPGQNLAINAMKTFGTYSSIPLCIAVFGALCAFLINYLLGLILYKIYRKYARQDIQVRHQQFAAFFLKYAFLILFFGAFTSCQTFMTFLAGFARLGILPFVVYSVLSSAIYYMFI